MSIVVPNAVVLPGFVTVPVCTDPIRENTVQTTRIDHMTCCTKVSTLCIAQDADKTFQLQDVDTTDYSEMAEAKFKILSAKGGTTLLEKTFTGGDIILTNNYTLRFSITDEESAALNSGSKYWGLFVQLSGGDQIRPGEGPFIVEKTEGFD